MKRSLKLRILSIFCLLIISMLITQENSKVPDSLKSKSAEELVALIKNSRPEEAYIYEKAFLERYGEDINAAGSFYELGKFFYHQENYEKSITYLDIAKRQAETSKNDKVLCMVYVRYGHVYMQEWKNEEALRYYEKALKIAREKRYLKDIVDADSGKAIIMGRMNKLDEALEACEEMLELFEDASYKGTKDHVNVLAVTSDTYLYMEQYDIVLHYVEQGIKISDSLDYKLGLVDLYIKKAKVFYYKKEYDNALEYLCKAELILLEEDLKNAFFQKADVNYFLAKCDYEKGLYQDAIRRLEGMIESLKVKDLIKDPVRTSHQLLALCYMKVGNNVQALYWYNKHEKLQKLFTKEKKAIDKIYDKETQQNEKEIKRLKKENKIMKKKNKTMRGALIISIVISVVLLVLLLNYLKKQRSSKLQFNNLIAKVAYLESVETTKAKPIKDTTKAITIDDNKVHKILKGITRLEKQEYFLSPECNLRTMAKKIKTNVTYLSRIINEHKGKSFNDYINELRIAYVLKRLKNDERFRLFSVKAIAAEIGYKSENSFTKHFRSRTGLNPSYYIKNINKLQQKNRKNTS